MASRMRKRSVLRTPSRADWTEFLYCTSPIAARIEIKEITIKSSTRVKPRSRRLPVSVFGSIEGLAFRLAIDVEHVAAPPRRGVGLVRIRAHPPFRRPRNRIDRNAAEEFEFDAGRVVVLGDAVD